MIYRFYNGAPDNTLKYVETILPLIGNVKEFEVFREQEDTPYVVLEDEEKKRYTFVLKDDKEDEFWLYTLCGYAGSGPNATLKILQLLGIKEDFRICEEGNIHIKKKNLNPVHKLNLLVAQDKSDSYLDEDLQYNLVVSIDFKYAYQKQNFIKALKTFGYIQHILPDERKLYEKAYVFDELDTPPYEYYYYTNNIFTLNREFKGFSTEQIQIMVKSMIESNGGKINYESVSI